MSDSGSPTHSELKCVGEQRHPTTRSYGEFMRRTRWDEHVSHAWEKDEARDWVEDYDFDYDALQARHLDSVTFRFPFTALPPELQVEVIEWLPDPDLKCLA